MYNIKTNTNANIACACVGKNPAQIASKCFTRNRNPRSPDHKQKPLSSIDTGM